jgi:hypothetical protein
VAHPVVDVAIAVDVPLVRPVRPIDVEREWLHPPVVVRDGIGKEALGALEERARSRQRVGVGVLELRRDHDVGHGTVSSLQRA